MSNRRFNIGHQSGFSLVEVLIAAGMLGIVATGAMSLFENINKNQKTMDIKSLRGNIQYELTLTLRDKIGCERTFAGKVPAGSPPNPGNVNPAVTVPVGVGASVDIPMIWTRVGTPSFFVGQVIDGTSAKIEIQSIQLINPANSTCGLDEECPHMLRVTTSNRGRGQDLTGSGSGSLTNAYARQTEQFTFPLRFKRWGPSYPPTTAGINDGLVDECLSADTAYLDEACNAMGGIMTGGACQRIRVTGIGDNVSATINDTDTGLTVGRDMQVLRNAYVTSGLVIGPNPGPGLNGSGSGLGVGVSSPGSGRAAFQTGIAVGTGMPIGVGDASFGGDLRVADDATITGDALIQMTTTSTGLITGNNGVTVNNAGVIVNGATSGNYVLVNSADATDGLEIANGGDLRLSNFNSDIFVNNGFVAGATPTGITLFGNSATAMQASGSILISNDLVGAHLALKSTDFNSPSLTFEINDTGTAVTSFDNGARIYLPDSSNLVVEGGYLWAPEDIAHLGSGPNGTYAASTVYRVATRKYVENLLVGDIDRQKWDAVITDIINTIYGAADYVMGDAIARYICTRFRMNRGAVDGSTSDFSWNGSDCVNTDYWDDIEVESCPQGQYIYYSSGTGTLSCIQWPASAVTPSENISAGVTGGATYRFLEHCIIIGTNKSGDVTCYRKRFYIRNIACCTCGCGDPAWINNVCAALGGSGFYDPAIDRGVSCTGGTIASLADDPATDTNFAAVYISGPPPECGGDHKFRIQDCERTATSVRNE